MDWLRGLIGGGPAPRLSDADVEEAPLLAATVLGAQQQLVEPAVVHSDTASIGSKPRAAAAAAHQQQAAQQQAAQPHPCSAVEAAPQPLLAKQAKHSSASALCGHPADADLKIVIPSVSQAQGGKQAQAAPGKQAAAAAADRAAGSTAAALKAAAYGITNLTSVVAIVFANKLVLYTYKFGFAVTLTWLHCVFTALGMMLLAWSGVFEVKRVSLAKSLPVASAYVASIVLNNLSIKLNTVGFYQISKIAITPVIVAIELLSFGKVPSGRVLCSIVVLLTGIALATVSDSQVASRPLGMLVAAVNVVITGLYQVWAGSKQKELGLNGLQLLHQVSPSSVGLLLVLIPLLEPVGLTSPGPGTILGFTLTPAAAVWIVVSCGLGLVVTLSTFLFIGATSSLTYNVVGHLKTVAIVAGGVVIFGDSMAPRKLAGLVIALTGIVWYSHIKMREADKAPGKQ